MSKEKAAERASRGFFKIISKCKREEDIAATAEMFAAISLKLLAGIHGKEYLAGFCQSAIDDPEVIKVESVVKH